jgi:hypothetical protein
MGNRLVLAMVAAVAIVAVGGIGFAAFTANAYVNGTATGGLAEIHFSGSATVYAYGSYVSCGTPSFSSYGDPLSDDNVMTVAGTGFSPGDYCQYSETGVNGGSVGVNVASAFGGQSISGGSGCGTNEWTLSDNGPWDSVGPGGTFTVTVTVELNSNAGNECQSATLSFTDTLTGTSYA